MYSLFFPIHLILLRRKRRGIYPLVIEQFKADYYKNYPLATDWDDIIAEEGDSGSQVKILLPNGNTLTAFHSSTGSDDERTATPSNDSLEKVALYFQKIGLSKDKAEGLARKSLYDFIVIPITPEDNNDVLPTGELKFQRLLNPDAIRIKYDNKCSFEQFPEVIKKAITALREDKELPTPIREELNKIEIFVSHNSYGPTYSPENEQLSLDATGEPVMGTVDLPMEDALWDKNICSGVEERKNVLFPVWKELLGIDLDSFDEKTQKEIYKCFFLFHELGHGLISYEERDYSSYFSTQEYFTYKNGVCLEKNKSGQDFALCAEKYRCLEQEKAADEFAAFMLRRYASKLFPTISNKFKSPSEEEIALMTRRVTEDDSYIKTSVEDKKKRSLLTPLYKLY